MTKKFPQSLYSYIRIFSSFGLTLGINIYLLSVLLGGWLDEKFHTQPLLRLVLLFLAIAMSFLYLFKQIQIVGDMEKENRKNSEDGDDL